MKTLGERNEQSQNTVPVLFCEEFCRQTFDAKSQNNNKTTLKFFVVKSVADNKTEENETTFNEQPKGNHIPLDTIQVLPNKNDLAQPINHLINDSPDDHHVVCHIIVDNTKNFQSNHRRKENTFQTVAEFCVTSTIDALQYVVGKRGKWFWIPFFTLVGLYCCYQCKLNLDTYFHCDLSTKIVDELKETLDFPAITICPMRTFKRSMYGNLLNYENILSKFYANSFDEVKRLRPQNKRSCNNKNNLTNEMKKCEYIKFSEKLKSGLIWMSNEFSITYQDILQKCVWNQKRIKCSDAFLNHMSDFGNCFTFNPGDGIAEFTKNTMTGYGLNLANYSESQYTIGPGHSGLKLFFNIKQSEYCGNEITKRGAGLFFQIHGTNRKASYLINPSIYISPGYDTKVIMKKQIYNRKTEHLGRCKSFVPLYLTPNASFYILEHCYMQCVAEHVLRLCKCYPTSLGGFEKVFLNKAKDLGLSKESVQVCLGQQFICLNQWLQSIMSNTSIDVLCPYCKQPCDETKYSVQMTSLLLSPRNLEILPVQNLSFSELRKNYLIVNFAFKSTSVQVIAEQQAFDLKDLFIYIGNNIGLYLGMSFTTFFELVYFIMRLLSLFVNHIYAKYQNYFCKK